MSFCRPLKEALFLVLIFLLPAQLGLHLWPDWSFVSGIRVDYLSPTIYLTDLLFITLLVIWLLEKKFSVFSKISKRTLSLILITILYFLITSLFSSNSGAALYKLLKFIELGFMSWFVFCHQSQIFSQKAKRILSLGIILLSLIAVGQVFKQSSLGGVFWFLGERSFTVSAAGVATEIISGIEVLRPYSTFSHPNSLAGYLLVVLVLLVPWKGVLTRFATLLGAITILLTFSHTVWFAAGFIFIARVLRLQAKSLQTSLLLTVIALTILPFAGQELLPYQEVVIRKELLTVSWEIFKNNFLFGTGLNNFVVQLPKYWVLGSVWWLQPVHNIFLLFVTEAGIFGLVLVALLFRRLQLNGLSLALVAIVITGSLDHYWLTLQQNQLLLAIVLGLSSNPSGAKLS